MGVAEKIVTANVRWLAGHRHPRHHQPGLADALPGVFASPAPSIAGAEAAGDPIATIVAVTYLGETGTEVVAGVFTVSVKVGEVEPA